MRNREWRVAVIAMLVAVGCASERTAPEKCDDLINDLCNRAVTCIGGSTQTQCVQEVQQSLACGKAVSVTTSYDRCIDQLNTDACAVLFPTDPSSGQPTVKLPADCQGVILTQ